MSYWRFQTAGNTGANRPRQVDFSTPGRTSFAGRITRAIRQIRVNIPAGGQIPLAQVAKIETAEGASFVYRENLERYVPVRFTVGGRDLKSTVEDAKHRIARDVKLPEGVHLQWAGEYGDSRRRIDAS